MITDVLASLQVLADPTRLAIFGALLEKERCVRDLTDALGHAQPLVSHHLRALSGAGLVRSRPQDGFRMYAVDPDGLAACRDRLAAFLDPAQLGTVALPGGNRTCCQP